MSVSLAWARVAVLAAAVTLCAAAPAPPSSATGPDAAQGGACFSPRQIINYSTPDISVVLVRIGKGGDVFELTFESACPNVDWTYGFRVRGGAREVCEGKDQEVLVVPVRTSDSGLSVRCKITGVRRLTPDEVAALSGRKRP